MSEILNRALEAMQRLPQERQDELARYVLALSEGPGRRQLSADEVAAIAEAEAELARGETAPQDQVEAFWRRNGL
jgi:mono/diheme cytochrome c family protein